MWKKVRRKNAFRKRNSFDLIIKLQKRIRVSGGIFWKDPALTLTFPRDIFQDYDVVYVVNETKSFREDRHLD